MKGGLEVKALVDFISNLAAGEEGQTLTEYGLILFFIAVVAIVAVELLGTNVTAFFESIANSLAIS